MIISVHYKQPVDGFYQYEVDYKNFFNKMKETRTFFFFFILFYKQEPTKFHLINILVLWKSCPQQGVIDAIR